MVQFAKGPPAGYSDSTMPRSLHPPIQTSFHYEQFIDNLHNMYNFLEIRFSNSTPDFLKLIKLLKVANED